jgi:hypothetical protein
MGLLPLVGRGADLETRDRLEPRRCPVYRPGNISLLFRYYGIFHRLRGSATPFENNLRRIHRPLSSTEDAVKRRLALTLLAVSSMAAAASSQCNNPSSPGVVICTPTNGATVVYCRKSPSAPPQPRVPPLLSSGFTTTISMSTTARPATVASISTTERSTMARTTSW